MMHLICPACNTPFERIASQVRGAEKRGQSAHYCSPSCHREIGATSRSGLCVQCNTKFIRHKRGGNDRVRFCSKSCATRHNNLQRAPTSRKKPTCPDCGGPRSWGGATCGRCRTEKLNSRTLAELRAAYTTAAFHAKIRGMARSAYNGPRHCAACGYSLHVDICHVRNVQDFPLTAALNEVNAPGNLVALDKRCHWEFDNGYLHLEFVNGEWAKGSA